MAWSAPVIEEAPDNGQDVAETTVVAAQDSGFKTEFTDSEADVTDADLLESFGDSESVEALRQFADKIGFECEDREIGLGICINGDKILSAYAQIVEVPVGARGWVESRQAAADLAELQAKAKIIAYLEEGIGSNQSFDEFEKFVNEVGDSKEILPEDQGEWNQLKENMSILAKKGTDFTNAKLDKRITEIDPLYDTEQYKKQPPKTREARFRRRWSQGIITKAEELLRGAVPIFSHESVDAEKGKSRVLVAVIWTPSTKRVAASIAENDYNAKALNPNNNKGAPAKSKIPEDKDILLGAFGSRMYLDEKGEHYVLVFSQAGVRRSQSRQEQAEQSAMESAELRAKGNLARFIANYIETARTGDDSENIAEFSDQSTWRENRREHRLRVSSRTKTVRLRGVHLVSSWKARHPATDQTVVGTVIKWSPADALKAGEIRRTINNLDSPQDSAAKKEDKKIKNDYKSKPLIIDLGAY